MKDKRSAPEYKREELMKLMSEGFNIVHVFDDHPGVIEVCNELGLPNTKVPGYEEASAMMEDLAKSEKWVSMNYKAKQVLVNFSYAGAWFLIVLGLFTLMVSCNE